MLILALFSWWYSTGWGRFARRLVRRLSDTLDFFSIGALLMSLFSPYRQLSAGKVQGPLGVQLRAWADRQISRAIGAVVRLVVIIFGLVATLFTFIIELLLLIAWPLVPLLPVIAIVVILGVRR